MSNRFYALVTFLLSFVVLAYFYHEVLLNPNDYLFAPGGDGIKNYYTYLYHAKYESSFFHFEGMNYPFYEHMVYTDGHPLLSWLVGRFGLAEYGIGILNLLMLFSYPICAVFLFKIFSHYKVNVWWAIVAALVITFMSPQVYRMTGHFSLSYVFAVPMMWWLLIKVSTTEKWIWSFIICFYLLAFFYTHPYLGIILAFFSLSFAVVNIIFYRELWKKTVLKLAIQVALPFIVFNGLIMLTDTHTDRMGTPAGFFDYYASWKSILLPHDGPLSFFVSFFGIDIGNWESWNYVGFSTIVFGFIMLFYLIKKRKEISLKTIAKSELGMYMIAAYLVLLFAFCFPLKYDFLRWIVDLFGPLKQFRVLGRFGWIFFYVFTVFTVIGLYRIYLTKKNKIPLISVFIAGTIFSVMEFYPVHKMNSFFISQAPNPFKKEILSDDMIEMTELVDKGDYDAIIFVPFTHLSSENIMLLGTEAASYDAFLLSYHTQTPLMNSVSSRMSITEAILVNNFFSPEFIEKDLVYLLDPEAKILIVKNMDGANPDELRLLHSSNFIYENENFSAYEFVPEKWNTNYYFEEIVSKEKNSQIDVGNGWKSDTSNVWFLYESFDTIQGKSLGGSGSLHGKKGGYDCIYEFNTAGLESGIYTISFWYYLRADRPDVLAVAEQDSIGDKKKWWYSTYEVAQSKLIVEDWCFVSLDVEVSSSIEKVNVLITGNGNKQPFYIDELLVRKSDSSPLFRRAFFGEQEFIIYNNYWIKANSFQKN